MNGRTSRGVTSEVIGLLQARILKGLYKPGVRLPAERALSEEVGVSRPTIREAIQALAAMNILEIRRGSGVYVAGLDVQELLEPLQFAVEIGGPTVESLFEVRLVLEPLAARLAASRASEQELTRMQLCVDEASRSEIGLRRFLVLDTELHESIVVAARNPLLSNLLASLSFLSRESRERTARVSGVLASTTKDHQTLIRALRARDGKRAEAAMQRHLRRVQKVALENATRAR